jgi:hypothetical protein
MKVFLSFCGIRTSFPNKAKKAIKKAGPSTHGKGNKSKLKATPPKAPIKSVLEINLIFFIKFLSLKITVIC